ncbi:thiamine phosphate synthase [uncultured Methylobacterium sp.]|uniref:thiamine phosphate synthase n=1 Tax=uncultured Methylobacterium sp. TaxID=157278 RepID=UPI0035CBA779
MRALPSPLLVVTDRLANPVPSAGEGAPRVNARHLLLATIDAVLAGGAGWVWFRERDMDEASRRTLAIAVMIRVHAGGGTFSLGGDAALAAEIGADGVHLPGGTSGDAIRRARDLLPDGIVGTSAHILGEIEVAAKAGANYATLSPVFPTASKPGYGPALGTAALRAASAFGMPVIALGGITPINAGDCRDAGAAGIAVMGGVMRATDPARAAAAFLDGWAQRPDGP